MMLSQQQRKPKPSPRNKGSKSKRPDLVSPLILSNFSTVDTKDLKPNHVTFTTLATNPSPREPKQLVPKILRESHSQLALSDLKTPELHEHLKTCSECAHSHKMI
jgi:hypothetical protein